jgi:hypothetical protein
MGRREAPALTPTDEMRSATRAAVVDITCRVPSGEPLVVKPSQAPVGSLDSSLVPLIVELRKMLSNDVKENGDAAAHTDDFTLARFLIARECKLAGAERMFRETMKWRVSRSINQIRRDLHPLGTHAEGSPGAVRAAARREHFFAGFGGHARDGSPFFIERLGRFDVAGVNRDKAVFNFMMDCYVGYLETAFSACRVASAHSGRMTRAHSIVDASGVSLSTMANVRVIKEVAKIGTSYYPEIMRKVTIVNLPWAFAAVWKLVAPLLPEQTRQKVAIYGSDFLPALLDDIDEADLPAFLGGKKDDAELNVPRAAPIPAELGPKLAAAAATLPYGPHVSLVVDVDG